MADSVVKIENLVKRYKEKVALDHFNLDLKTGKIPAKIEQLEIYAALFCLEYKVKPGDIDIELRIYQNDEILYHRPTAEDILPIMDTIVHLDKLLEKIDQEED